MRVRGARKVVLGLAVVATTLVAAPAHAHGNCSMTFTPPTWDGNVSSGNWSWRGVVSCTEEHPDYTQWSCLQSSPTNGLLIGWTNEWCSSVHSWAGPGKTFTWSYIPASYTSCTRQYWYRVTGYGSAGNGGYHWSMPGTSASVVACPI